MTFGINRHGVIHFSTGRLGLLYVPPWCWLGEQWRSYLWSYILIDSDGLWWLRCLGLEISWRR